MWTERKEKNNDGELSIWGKAWRVRGDAVSKLGDIDFHVIITF